MSRPAELVIEVTAEDIRLGERTSVCRCPIARAAHRALGMPLPSDDQPLGEVTAYAGGIDLWNASGCDWITYDIPAEATDFIRAFDSGRDVAPFAFTARLEATS